MHDSLYCKGDDFYAPGFAFSVDFRLIGPGENRSQHWHDYCEVELVTRGSGVHRLNDRRYTLEENCVYIVTPMDFHEVETGEEEGLELYHVQFGCSVLRSDLMGRIARAREQKQPGLAVRLSDDAAARVRAVMEEMREEFALRREDGVDMLRVLLERLCLLILREAEREGNATPEKRTVEMRAALNQATQYVQYHFRSPITLADTAAQVHLSCNYFGELFHTHMGMTFLEYLRAQRISYACRLLSESSLSITEIARESGFRTVSYFAEIFRRQYGMTPGQFRRTNRAVKEEI